MKSITECNYIKTNTILFAQNTCQAIFDMVGIPFDLCNESLKEGTFSSSYKMIIYIHFSGTIQGEYILSMDEMVAAKLIGLYQDGMSYDQIIEMRCDYGDFLKELLNLSVSQSIVELEKSFGDLTFTSSTVVYGEIDFPEVISGTVNITGLNSVIDCGFSLNLAKLKIGQEFEKALAELEKKTTEINEANNNIKNILELVPSGLVAINSEYKILPGHSKATVTVVGFDNNKEIVGLSLPHVLGLKPEDSKILITWLDNLFLKFGQIPFESLISEFSINEVINIYGKILKLKWLPVISDKSNLLEKILVIIEDITEQRRLEITVKDSSHAISCEYILNKLFLKMIKITMDSTDAQKCVLILEKKGKYYIEAQRNIYNSEVIMQTISIDKIKKQADIPFPFSIIDYVLQSKNFIMLDGSIKDSDFATDPYIISYNPRSILCIPLIYKGKMTGIIYLENRIKPNIFTQNRRKALDLIAAQFVISIENARLYDDLNLINEQINHLLEVTREMSRSKNKIMAGTTALVHLLALMEKIDIRYSYLYIFNQTGNIESSYSLWKDEEPAVNPSSCEVSENKLNLIKKISEIIIFDGILIIPIKSHRLKLAALEIECFTPFNEAIIESSRRIIEGIADSLALTMEHIESEEKGRLASIGSMAASIAHDLKNSIGIIMGYADMAVDYTIGNDMRNEYISIISKEASQMLNMAYEMLDYCKGELNLNLSEIYSKDYIVDLAKTLSPIFKSNNILFEYNIAYLGLIKIDPDRIRRVIFNLATNARDAMVVAKTENAKFIIELKADKEGILFIARDNGPGIPDHIKSTLFEPFVTYGKSNGVGLGMAIVKKIIEAHGGNISFVTEKGKGTQFCVYIPMDAETFKKSPEIDKGKSIYDDNNYYKNIYGKRILVVDDNPICREMCIDICKQWGCYIDEAINGEKALNKLKEAKTNNEPFDVVIVDKIMPGMDGIDLGSKIKKDHNLRDTILIMSTAFGERGDAVQTGAIGFSAYLTKPISSKELFLCLSALLDKDIDKPDLITRYTLPDVHKSKILVLLVEDNVVNQKLILRFINKIGFSADVVSNGKEAICALEKRNYDIVLMDIQMPEMNGYEATRLIRDLNKSKVLNHNITIIAMTGHSMKEDIDKCMEAGMNDYISKPIQFKRLSQVIEKQLIKIEERL